MKRLKYLLFFGTLLMAQQLFSQNFIPKFVEPEFSTIIDTTKLQLPESFKNFEILPSNSFKMQEPPFDNFPKNWEDFKRAFLALQLPVEYQYFYKNLSFMNQWLRKRDSYQYSMAKTGFNPMTPIQSFYDAFSKDGKEIRKYNELLRNDFLEKSVGEKCPMEMVKLLTGTESDSTIYAFFRFCNFSQEQIDHATPYDVCVLVTENWERFVGIKEE